MAADLTEIPDKLYFKIGEVCDLVGVQAHVLRYWETEFPSLSPQKNKSGQRSYRRKDVETALKIKQLLYKEMFTIAGARKKLQSDSREANRPKDSSPIDISDLEPSLFDSLVEPPEPAPSPVASTTNGGSLTDPQREALRKVGNGLIELREMLRKHPFA